MAGYEAGALEIYGHLGAQRNPKFLLIGVVWGPTKDLDLDIGWHRTRHDPGARRTLGLGATVRW